MGIALAISGPLKLLEDVRYPEREDEPASAEEVITRPSTSRLERRLSRRSSYQTAGSTSRNSSVELIPVSLSSNLEEDTPSRKRKSVLPPQSASPGSLRSAPKRSKKPKIGGDDDASARKVDIDPKGLDEGAASQGFRPTFSLVWRRRRSIPKSLRQTPRLVLRNQHLPSSFCFSCDNIDSLRMYPLGHGRLQYPGLEDGRARKGL